MKKAKIMIVEDEILIAVNLKVELSYRGYEICDLLTSGEDAVKNVEHEKPDIVLMDIILNGKINGIEAAREIHSRYGIPIIFVTGCQEEGTISLAKKAVEHAEYLIKPVEIEDLKSVIENVLKKRGSGLGQPVEP